MIAFKERLDKILERLISDDLLGNQGLGNEIGFYIFDYPAEYEMELIGDTPLVMFYPGVYTGQGLKLFGKMKEINYYRAFQLVPQ